MMTKTLGGDRLGTGKRMSVDLGGYPKSTHDLSYIFRSPMSAGTLVPCMSMVAVPEDEFRIEIDADCQTQPTIGPLFGSHKFEVHIFTAPIRLYNALLHNNTLGIGLNMSQVKLPQITLGTVSTTVSDITDIDNSQINPSCILSYLGIRGIGWAPGGAVRSFNATALIAYWDIYGNYYANKQEEEGAVIHVDVPPVGERTVDDIQIYDPSTAQQWEVKQKPLTTTERFNLTDSTEITINYDTTAPNLDEVYLLLEGELSIPFNDLVTDSWTVSPGIIKGVYNFARWGARYVVNWYYMTNSQRRDVAPRVVRFALSNLNDMRTAILAHNSATAFEINGQTQAPYGYLVQTPDGIPNVLSSQEGLGIKTYNSDLFNNWLKAEFVNYVATASAVSTVSGSFTMDQLNLAQKVYELLNRIMVSGGTYDDWIDAAWSQQKLRRAESPIFNGGLIKELVFQEVVSNAETATQPLGTLAGKGIFSRKHEGGLVHISVTEPSYILGIASLTPRIDYSQGNSWDVNLKHMDELHKPGLDQIGFQDLITEQLAWWDTTYDTDNEVWVQKSAGKQPAWSHYMTAVNRTYSNFAIRTNEMFMTNNRRYEWDESIGIVDLTTYIDPVKYNFIFAETRLDAQNYRVQIAFNIQARRLMSAKIMPNL